MDCIQDRLSSRQLAEPASISFTPLLQVLGVRPWSLHLTWVWGQQQGKRYRLQEAGLWRGEAAGSAHYGGPSAAGGAAAERFLAMDIIHPQVGTACEERVEPPCLPVLRKKTAAYTLRLLCVVLYHILSLRQPWRASPAAVALEMHLAGCTDLAQRHTCCSMPPRACHNTQHFGLRDHAKQSRSGSADTIQPVGRPAGGLGGRKRDDGSISRGRRQLPAGAGAATPCLTGHQLPVLVCIRLRPAASAALERVFGNESLVAGAWLRACGHAPHRYGTAGTSPCC